MPEKKCEKYVVELENGVWLAPWKGDPGRTLKFEHASFFIRPGYAHTALARAREYRPFANAKVRTVKRGIPCSR